MRTEMGQYMGCFTLNVMMIGGDENTFKFMGGVRYTGKYSPKASCALFVIARGDESRIDLDKQKNVCVCKCLPFVNFCLCKSLYVTISACLCVLDVYMCMSTHFCKIWPEYV